MIYFTSDLHLGHNNIIKLSDRPFRNIDEMNRALIQNWNAVVSPRDEIYILGDLSFRKNAEDVNEWLKKLNGIKYLIKGNHDKYLDSPDFEKQAFGWVKDYFVLPYNKIRFVLFHYPIHEWDGYFQETVHLHGHVHEKLIQGQHEQKERRAINVGVDVSGFMPVSIDTVCDLAFNGKWRCPDCAFINDEDDNACQNAKCFYQIYD